MKEKYTDETDEEFEDFYAVRTNDISLSLQNIDTSIYETNKQLEQVKNNLETQIGQLKILVNFMFISLVLLLIIALY